MLIIKLACFSRIPASPFSSASSKAMSSLWCKDVMSSPFRCLKTFTLYMKNERERERERERDEK